MANQVGGRSTAPQSTSCSVPVARRDGQCLCSAPAASARGQSNNTCWDMCGEESLGAAQGGKVGVTACRDGPPRYANSALYTVGAGMS